MAEGSFYYTDLFKKIANEQKVQLNKRTAEQGMTYVQSLVILYLLDTSKHAEVGPEVTQRHLEQYLSLKGSTVTKLLDRMAENGYITRVKSKRDSRANCIYPTELGISFVPYFYEALHRVESTMTKGMTEGEKETLKDLLKRVLANLEDNKNDVI